MCLQSKSDNLISVIIPTYNRADMVVEAIESVRRQTWQQTQIIVVDDGSTDDTVARVQQMPDVLLLKQKSQRQAAARNHGLQHVRGDYVCSLDSDDIWQPEFLELNFKALRDLNADFVFANWVSLDKDGLCHDSYFQTCARWWEFPQTQLPGWRLMSPPESRRTYLDMCVSPSSSMLFRRDLLANGWVETMKIGDDWCLILDQVVKRECRVAFTMRPLWTKRVSTDNLFDRRDFGEVRRDLYVHDVKLIRGRLQTYLTQNESARLSGQIAFHQLGLAKLHLKRKQFSSVLKHGGGGLQHLIHGLARSPQAAYAGFHSVDQLFRAEPDLTSGMLAEEGIASVHELTNRTLAHVWEHNLAMSSGKPSTLL